MPETLGPLFPSPQNQADIPRFFRHFGADLPPKPGRLGEERVTADAEANSLRMLRTFHVTVLKGSGHFLAPWWVFEARGWEGGGGDRGRGGVEEVGWGGVGWEGGGEEVGWRGGLGGRVGCGWGAGGVEWGGVGWAKRPSKGAVDWRTIFFLWGGRSQEMFGARLF